MTTHACIAVLALIVLAMPGCAKGAERSPQPPDSVASPAAVPTRDSAAEPAASATSIPTPPPASPTYTVTERGIGPLKAGMTFAEADAALGGALLVPVGVDTTG